jgi:regulation of enolase protein 1 (concanavalin A-like superfamily)
MFSIRGLGIALSLLAVFFLALAAGLPFGIAPERESAKLMAAPVPKALAEDRFRFLAYEGFDGTLRLNWKPVRSDPSHVSLTKHRGKLTITTQRGTIHGNEKAANEPSAKNLFLIENPFSKDADFVMTTCITEFEPTVRYQQAGLLVYDDDDNYAKFSYEFNWPKGEGQHFILVLETDAKPQHFPAAEVSDLKKVWLRLTKHGKSYEYATSTDGKSFTAHGTQEWGDGGPKMLGLVAKNGGPDGVPEIEANFDFFELRSRE